MEPKQRKEATSIAGRAINWLTDKLGITEAPTYTDGYGVKRQSEVSFNESAQGQELEQMFKDYLTNQNNIDNAISDTYKRIQRGRWDYFADWVNKYVLSFSPLIILPTTIKNNENE